MPEEPADKYAVAFFDGQNLFHHAKAAFGYNYPNFDPSLLAQAVCAAEGWKLTQVRFYTGVPDPAYNRRWHDYWTVRLTAMRRAGIIVTKRTLRYSTDTVELPDGTTRDVAVPREKGIDLRIGLDVVRMARNGQLDVALVFSQDQDLAEVATEIRDISGSTNRWLKIASAFPDSATASSSRGINDTDWKRIDRALYDSCLDPRDYRRGNW